MRDGFRIAQNIIKNFHYQRHAVNGFRWKTKFRGIKCVRYRFQRTRCRACGGDCPDGAHLLTNALGAAGVSESLGEPQSLEAVSCGASLLVPVGAMADTARDAVGCHGNCFHLCSERGKMKQWLGFLAFWREIMHYRYIWCISMVNLFSSLSHTCPKAPESASHI